MSKKIALIICLTMLLLSVPPEPANAGMIDRSEAVMKMHHLHIMMNNGIMLATDGSNMVMLSGMNMLPEVDKVNLHHGRSMIEKSKPLISRTLSGPVIMDLHRRGYINDPVLHYTEKLGTAMLDVVEILEKMSMGSVDSPELMKMNHLHSMLNHALGMASEGSNLSILGHMGKAGDVMDAFAVEQGIKMMKDAKSLVSDIMDGATMKELFSAGKNPGTDPMMNKLHKLAETSATVIDMLEKMPTINLKIEIDMK